MANSDYISREAALDAISEWLMKALHPENMSSYSEGERAAYRTALSEIADLPAADVRPRWIPVAERLPGKAGHYIVFVELKCNGQKISAWTQVTWFFEEFILECPEDEKCFVATVTHWMPLPEPPEEE